MRKRGCPFLWFVGGEDGLKEQNETTGKNSRPVGVDPDERMGLSDVTAFILAAFSHILPFTLIVIGIFAALLIILKIMF